MIKVLLVEDSPFEAALTSIELQQALEIEVEVTHSGAAALFSLSNQIPGLIILDLNLPDQSGLEVCRLVKHDSRTRSVPVVMFSGETKSHSRAKAYEAGADFYINKSEEGLENLQHLVRTILQRRQSRYSASY